MLFVSSFATLALAIAAVRAGPTGTSQHGLSVSLAAPQSLTSVDGLKIVASLTNGGSTDVRVLNFGGILDGGRPTRSFTVSKNGVDAEFRGIEYLLSIPDLDTSAYTTIRAGQTLRIEHDISALFDVESLGEGDFDITPMPQLHVMPVGHSNMTSFAEATGAKTVGTQGLLELPPAGIRINLKGDIKRRDLDFPGLVGDGGGMELGGDDDLEFDEQDEGHIESRATNICKRNGSWRKTISSSYPGTKKLGAVARDYVKKNGKSALFKKYFGNQSTKKVADVLNRVAVENDKKRTVDCVASCKPGVVAYTVFPGSNIFMCPFWFKLGTLYDMCHKGYTGMVKGEAFLHELTHATSHTVDASYGCDNDVKLNKATAINNADSYNCFSKEVWKKTSCGKK
ncbi:hypothetical protein BKA62DRAFT_349430 [Auriculariales sp. MPI-PUGE-AT-0066]|nr:hypothetical protein BKA62DRAFT_349430 [Auriculariales sp. MPI-PUGE-AT-0066]